MVRHALAASAALALVLAAAPALAQAPPSIAAAVADAGRPDADKARDADRKPAEMLALAQVEPGETVLELFPGGGYFTRLLAKAVGPEGKVYAAAPPPPPNAPANPNGGPAALAAIGANVTPTTVDLTKLSAPEPVDLIWTSQNYHDLHLKRLGLDVAAVDKQMLAALKPGGVLLVIDHAALAGAPLETADTLHRIDPAQARKELEAAGFVFEAESDALRNPADPKTAGVRDPSIRGKTDQFAMRFRKPAN